LKRKKSFFLSRAIYYLRHAHSGEFERKKDIANYKERKKGKIEGKKDFDGKADKLDGKKKSRLAIIVIGRAEAWALSVEIVEECARAHSLTRSLACACNFR